ncbi:g6578 [Coccomyxa elongata]
MGNPDPEVDPARGQLAVKSLPAQLVEVPNSEDDDDPLPVGITYAATLHTEPDNAAHHGGRSAEDLDDAAPSSAAGQLAPLGGTKAAAPSTGPRANAVLQQSSGAPEGRGSGWRSRSHAGQAAPATPATNAQPSSTAKENAAPKGSLTGLSTGKRAVQAGTSVELGARRTDAGQAGSASESQVPDYQVDAANATTANLIAQLAPNSEAQPPVAHVSLLEKGGRKVACQSREALPENEITHEEEERGIGEVDINFNVNDEDADEPDAVEERDPTNASASIQQRGGVKRGRPRKSTPAPQASAEDDKLEVQQTKKRKLLSKADTAALGRAQNPSASAKAPSNAAPKQSTARNPKSRATFSGGAKGRKQTVSMEEATGQPQERAGPSSAPTGATPPTGQRRDVQRRPFVALSGLHTKEILKFSPMLEALGVSHTDGLEDQHV